MKFLVIRFSSIGDIVLASPVFRCIKKQIPNSIVHLVTKESFKMVTASNPYIDDFFYYADDLSNLIENLKNEEYDYVVDLQNNYRSNKIKKALNKKTFTVNKLNIRKLLLTIFHINIMPRKHITIRSLETVKNLGIKDDGNGLDYFIPENDIVPETDLPISHSAGFIAIVIGASYYTKKLPVYKLQELCKAVDYPIILLGGKAEAKEGAAIAKVDEIKIYNAAGKFNLNESADLIRKSKLVISHDTGLLYIACAFNKPVLAIWGSTSPKLDVEPFYGRNFLSTLNKLPYENILVPKLWCQPCTKFGRNKCPLGHFNCMKKQDTDLIATKVIKKLKEKYA